MNKIFEVCNVAFSCCTLSRCIATYQGEKKRNCVCVCVCVCVHACDCSMQLNSGMTALHRGRSTCSLYNPRFQSLPQVPCWPHIKTSDTDIQSSGAVCGESQGGRPGLPIPNSPYGLCGCKAKKNYFCCCYHYL